VRLRSRNKILEVRLLWEGDVGLVCG